MIFIIAAIAILAVIVIVGIVVSVTQASSPESKGSYGESVVAQILGETVAGEQYVINNLLFEYEAGRSCQIDHVYINKFGIWVIETKNFFGYIQGDEEQREWTQVLPPNNESKTFYNPIKQNATHIDHLSRYLGVKNVFQNVVVFLSRADISDVTASNVYSEDGLSAIKNEETGITLSVDEMEHYYNKLSELKNTAAIGKEEHIYNIARMQAQIQQGICPRCGGKLVLRTGRNGQFYGCSNYPKCKFTKSLD